jgi:hypothetical protein
VLVLTSILSSGEHHCAAGSLCHLALLISGESLFSRWQVSHSITGASCMGALEERVWLGACEQACLEARGLTGAPSFQMHKGCIFPVAFSPSPGHPSLLVLCGWKLETRSYFPWLTSLFCFSTQSLAEPTFRKKLVCLDCQHNKQSAA